MLYPITVALAMNTLAQCGCSAASQLNKYVGKPMPTQTMTRHPNAAWVVFMEEENMGRKKIGLCVPPTNRHIAALPQKVYAIKLEPKKTLCMHI